MEDFKVKSVDATELLHPAVYEEYRAAKKENDEVELVHIRRALEELVKEKHSKAKTNKRKVVEQAVAHTEPVRPIDQKVQKALLQIIKDGRIKHACDYHVIMEILRSKYDMKFDNAQQFSDYMRGALGITHKAPKADNLNTYLSKMRGEYPKWIWVGKDERFADRCIKIANFFIIEMEKLQ